MLKFCRKFVNLIENIENLLKILLVKKKLLKIFRKFVNLEENIENFLKILKNLEKY